MTTKFTCVSGDFYLHAGKTLHVEDFFCAQVIVTYLVTPIDPLSTPSAAQSPTLSQRDGDGNGGSDGGRVTAQRWWQRQLGPWMWQLGGSAVAVAAWRWRRRRQLGSVGSSGGWRQRAAMASAAVAVAAVTAAWQRKRCGHWLSRVVAVAAAAWQQQLGSIGSATSAAMTVAWQRNGGGGGGGDSFAAAAAAWRRRGSVVAATAAAVWRRRRHCI